MIKEISAKEFRDSGALWFVNTYLHHLGMAICFDADSNTIFHALCKFRGFSQDCNNKGYAKIAEYMKDNAAELMKDID